MADALTSFCGSPFWDDNLTVNTNDPDLSDCFQQTILLWVPCALLWVIAPFWVFSIISEPQRAIALSWVSMSKSVVLVIQAVTYVGIMISAGVDRSNGETIHAVSYTTPAVILASYALMLFLIHFERRHGLASSGLQFIYWFLLLLCHIVMFRSKVMRTLTLGEIEHMAEFVLFYLHFPFVLVQLVLSCFAEKHVKFTPVSTDLEPSDLPDCPEESSSFLSKILFWWFNPMIRKGFKHALVREDLWNLNAVDRAKNVGKQFEKFWIRQLLRSNLPFAHRIYGKEKDSRRTNDVHVVEPPKKPKKPSLTVTLVRAFGGTFFVAALLKLVQDALQFVNPLLLKLLLGYMQAKDERSWLGYFYAALMFTSALVQSVFLHQYFHRCFLVGMRLRTAIVSAVYKKSLCLTSAARRSSTVGEIVNLMSVDAQRFMDLTTYLNMLWSAPFQIIIALYFLWETLGPSVLAGVGIMILMIPLNAVIATKSKVFQKKQMEYKDARIKLMSEILNGIKVLKLYAWEQSFQDKVLSIRKKELDVLRKAAYLNAASSFTWVCAPFLVSLTTFATYVMSDSSNVLDAQKAFVSLSLFNILRFPLSMLPMLISSMVQASVSVKRLNNFLQLDELDPNAVESDPKPKIAIEIENASFAWDDESGATLEDVTLTIPEGSLVAVVGQVGAGKSSLISGMLGEMHRLKGRSAMRGSVAYVPQQAWIQNATVHDNVTFGKPNDDTRYDQAIAACALLPDLEILPAGDRTEIGEKGINLSGGQKQRVSLARAVYADASIYLFDDPLSAVDSHVGKHIFEKVISSDQGILKNKTRVLVTHGISFLPYVDVIVVLSGGRISEIGTYKELLEQKGAFAEFLKTYLVELNESTDEETDVEDLELRDQLLAELDLTGEEKKKVLERQASVGTPKSRSRLDSEKSERKSSIPKSPIVSPVASASSPATSPNKKDDGPKSKLIEKEKVETGNVKLSVFVAYVKAIGYGLSGLIILLYILNNGASVGSNVWLSVWSNDKPSVNGTMDSGLRDMRLGVYGAFGGTQGLFTYLAALVLAYGAMAAGAYFHEHMLHTVLRSPMHFFDQTPAGRIINRFSKDVDAIDTSVPDAVGAALRCFFIVLTTIIYISTVTVLFIAVFVPLMVVFMLIQRYYVATSRQLKRLESVSRSPIYSHFGETITGASTIRAYHRSGEFIEESERRVDENQICYYPNIVSNRWLAVRLEFVGNGIVLFAALFAVIGRDHLDAGLVGLSVTYALSITQTLNWMVRMTSDLETNIVAVERVKEYTETPTEADWVVADRRPPPTWPSEGRVVFESYQTRYREGLDLVLRGISCRINGSEKIGIVGRTGAGKSSLTLALFRIIEPTGGRILIDDVDISKIGLHDLRGKLTIIPQDPVLFSGTLRMNLDPFDRYTDEQLWRALENAHLKTFVSSLTAGLNYECAEGGDNLSVGQRQLVCLARALLRKSKILVLDEATAAVDLETDQLIQRTIRVEFADCTVLTIAHRLNTIMDSTRIVVLDRGEVAEFDPPERLLANKASIFYGMAKDAGLV